MRWWGWRGTGGGLGGNRPRLRMRCFCRGKGKAFFFEKKNQKTFLTLGRSQLHGQGLIWKSFLLLFFKKEVLA
jgi:hypothetical protein